MQVTLSEISSFNPESEPRPSGFAHLPMARGFFFHTASLSLVLPWCGLR